MKWDPALLPVVIITLISLAAFIVVSIMAWPANKMIAKAFIAWCRSVPDQIRQSRDPEYRRRQQVIALYENIIFQATLAQAVKNKANRESADIPPADERAVRIGERRRERAAEDYGNWRQVAAEYLSKLDNADIEVIAEHKSRTIYKGGITPEEIIAFLWEERSLASSAPWLAAGHVEREIGRFGPLLQERMKDPGGA